ncbi:MAG TPA: HlyD family efflux transporter periplasmic adaptor subunit [Blastocatellia bacterium]|nr:HlyD family efflux transporter periplasmic adaptor subunit [Blastocatellia bacterium]
MKSKLLMRALLLITVLTVALLVVVTALRPSPVSVEVMGTRHGPLRVTVDAEGKTRVRDRFIVAAPVTGKLGRIGWRRGDEVRQGELIARIDPLPMAPLDPRQLAEAKARIAAAEQLKREADAAVEQVRANYEQAQREFVRAERLIETGDTSRQDFERIRNAEQLSRQQLEAARFRARAAASDVEVVKAALLAVEQAGQSGNSAVAIVRAPIAGRVLRVIEESERVITAGMPLVELSTPRLEIAIDALSVDAVKVKPGMPVLIEGWGGEPALSARVRLIEPSGFTKVSALGIEEQRVQVIADFVDREVPLSDAYRIEARIVTWEADQVLLAPLGTLFRNDQGWSTFIVENGVARRRDLEIGHRGAFEAEILKGLQEGERVIVHPSNQIVEGSRVIVRRE